MRSGALLDHGQAGHHQQGPVTELIGVVEGPRRPFAQAVEHELQVEELGEERDHARPPDHDLEPFPIVIGGSDHKQNHQRVIEIKGGLSEK
jgi:hypothetical protein